MVATFCHQIARDLPIAINDPDRELELVYIDDLVAAFMTELTGSRGSGFFRAEVEPRVPHHAGPPGRDLALLPGLALELAAARLPGPRSCGRLYGMYLSYLPEGEQAYALTPRTDPRGSLAEFIKSPGLGQIFVSHTGPGITRGNHYHDTKTEKFLVVAGEGLIRMRQIHGEEILSFPVKGEDYRVVDIPPGYTHSIENNRERDHGHPVLVVRAFRSGSARHVFLRGARVTRLKVMTVVGTRPEIIRLSRVMVALDRHLDHVLVHTGQNYDYELNQVFFEDLELRRPDHFLEAAGTSAAVTIGNIIARMDPLLEQVRPEALLVLGDTNSCLAAIAAKRRKVPVFHMEAGNRCFDQRVPEEINRVIVDHISDINLPYSDISRDYLLREGLPPDRVIKTGSPMLEVLQHYMPKILASDVVERLGLEQQRYFVVSAHREENVDPPLRFEKFVAVLKGLATAHGLPGHPDHASPDPQAAGRGRGDPAGAGGDPSAFLPHRLCQTPARRARRALGQRNRERGGLDPQPAGPEHPRCARAARGHGGGRGHDDRTGARAGAAGVGHPRGPAARREPAPQAGARLRRTRRQREGGEDHPQLHELREKDGVGRVTRVLVLTQYYAPEGPIPTSLAEGLVRRGFEVEVLTTFPHYRDGSIYGGYKQRPWLREVINGVPVTRVPLYPSHDRSPFRRILTYTSFGLSAAFLGRLLSRRPDVIYAYHPPTTSGIAALVHQVFRRHIPILYHVQDLWPEAVASSGMLTHCGAIALLTRITRFMYRRADRIIAISPGFKAAIAGYGVDPERIEVIYNWADENVAGPLEPDPALAGRLGMNGHFTIVYAGAMGTVQDLDTVLEAARKLHEQAPDVAFLLVGSGTEEARLKARAKAEGIGNVRFLPRCSPSEAVGIVGCGQAALVHLKGDPIFDVWIPGKTQSLLASGKPILLGVRGDAARLVEESGGGLCFQPSSPESLIEAILAMKRMAPKELAAMGTRGRTFYLERLAFDVAIDRIVGIINSCAKA